MKRSVQQRLFGEMRLKQARQRALTLVGLRAGQQLPPQQRPQRLPWHLQRHTLHMPQSLQHLQTRT